MKPLIASSDAFTSQKGGDGIVIIDNAPQGKPFILSRPGEYDFVVHTDGTYRIQGCGGGGGGGSDSGGEAGEPFEVSWHLNAGDKLHIKVGSGGLFGRDGEDTFVEIVETAK